MLIECVCYSQCDEVSRTDAYVKVFKFLWNSQKCIIWFQFLTCVICRGNLLWHWLLIYLAWLVLARSPWCIQLLFGEPPKCVSGGSRHRKRSCLPRHPCHFLIKTQFPLVCDLALNASTTLTSSVRHTLLTAAGSNSRLRPSVRRPVHIWVLTACLYSPCAQQSGTVMLRGRANRKLHF